MIKQNENGKDEWIPDREQMIPDKVIKEQRAAHREKFKFLQEKRKEEA